MPPLTDVDAWNHVRETHGPQSMEIADDVPGSYSFWKHWTLALADELKPFYRFLEQNDFTCPTGVALLEEVGPTDGQVPYVRLNVPK